MSGLFPTSAVVDTDVVSYLFRRDTRANLYRPHLENKLLVVSFMTVAELYRWAEERNWGEVRRAGLEERLRSFVVFPFDRSLCIKWAQVMCCASRNGQPIGPSDAWVAATALLHQIPLVTNNGRHFAGVDGLSIISEPNN